jgi:hypothetical protein
MMTSKLVQNAHCFSVGLEAGVVAVHGWLNCMHCFRTALRINRDKSLGRYGIKYEQK